MTTYCATGDPETSLTSEDLSELLRDALSRIGDRQRVLALPPDFTRFHSRAGELTELAYRYYGERMVDVMPALGTHHAMSDAQLGRMFGEIPTSLIREHRWREDVVTVGTVPAEYVAQVTEGIYDAPWPAQMNKLVANGGHDLILSLGQVVPHEVIGMANYNKNVFVGTGGAAGINESHFIGAAYGMERMMGRADTPLRRILNYAQREFCSHLPLLFVLTVVGAQDGGRLVTRGLFIGDDEDCFEQASALSLRVNFELLENELTKVVVYLDPDEFQSTWLGNKAIYRTRMAIAEGGELIIMGPAINTFGEDLTIDQLIRKYGYRTTPEIMQMMRDNPDLRANLSAAAHLIHGSPEDRFRVTYAPGHLTRQEIEGVGYRYADVASMLARYSPDRLRDGPNLVDDEEIFFVRNPALGLWSHRARFEA